LAAALGSTGPVLRERAGATEAAASLGASVFAGALSAQPLSVTMIMVRAASGVARRVIVMSSSTARAAGAFSASR
jgi:hypothetical protein